MCIDICQYTRPNDVEKDLISSLTLSGVKPRVIESQLFTKYPESMVKLNQDSYRGYTRKLKGK
jgi:hypothetical protein